MTPETAPGPRIAPRPRPVGLFHFVHPGHWTPQDLRQAADQGGQALLDSVVLTAFRLMRRKRSDEYMRNILADAHEALAVYDELGWLQAPLLAHAAPVAPDEAEVSIQSEQVGRHSYEHVTFPSSYVPQPRDPSSARWVRAEENRNVHAWMLRHPEPRPWIVNVHGAGMGRPRMDLRLFRAEWLHHELGLNVIAPVLPLHGPRRPEGRMNYPSESIMHNVHGTLQGVADVRRAIEWVRVTQPGQPIGIHGISLGGFITSLVASLEPDLACAVLGVAPLDLVLLLEAHHGKGSGYDLRVQNFEIGARLSSMVTPLKLQPAIPRERRFMYAGIVDRLVDYSDHVAPMVAHWDYPETLIFDGGHVGIGMARDVPGFLAAAYAKSGLVGPVS